MRKVGPWACLILALVLFTGCGESTTANTEDILFEVKKGDNFQIVSRRLHEMGVVNNPSGLLFTARIKFRANNLKFGVYQIAKHESYSILVDQLTSGHTYSVRITIPEGSTLFQVADILAAKKLADRQAFIRECSNARYLELAGLKAPNSLEGYLYPDTYLIPVNSDVDQIIRLLVGNFNRVVSPDIRPVAAKRKMDFRKLLTMASVIEKEAGQEFEKPVISGIFYNRLRLRYRLQSCATLIYALTLNGTYDGNIRSRDFAFRSKYNTYEVFGLPPGPICNPGRTSILAALYPADTDYLYFVAKGDGTHQFSRTLEEHNKAVYQYQKLPAIESRKNRQK